MKNAQTYSYFMAIRKFVVFWTLVFPILESVISGLYHANTIEEAGTSNITKILSLNLCINKEKNKTLVEFVKGGRERLARRTVAFENGKLFK